MLESLRLINFQSHEDSLLEFHPGINALVGESDHGKSAILRGFRWLRDNRPSGDEFISHWCWENGKMTGGCSVTATIPDAPVIIRSRDSRFNGYYVGATRLAAIRTDVPEEVSTLLNMSEVNDQYQMDPPFLIMESPPEIARFFNRSLKLEEVDQLMSLAEVNRQRAVAAVKSTQLDLEETARKVGECAWLDLALPLLQELQEHTAELETLTNRLALQKSAAERHLLTAAKLIALDWTEDVEIFLKPLKGLLEKVITNEEQLHQQERRHQWFQENQERLAGVSWADSVSPLVEELGETLQQISADEVKERAQSRTRATYLQVAEDLQKVLTLPPEAEDTLAQIRRIVAKATQLSIEIDGKTQSRSVYLDSVNALAQYAYLDSPALLDLARLKTDLAEIARGSADIAQRETARDRVKNLPLEIENAARSIDALIRALPEACPTCHRPYNEDSLEVHSHS